MSHLEPGDSWNEGHPYEIYVGRWSRLIASSFLSWLKMPSHLTWLDVGCGTGALTEAILEESQPVAVIGVEPSAGFLKMAESRVQGKAILHRGYATAIPVADGSVDVVVSGLVLNFIVDSVQGLLEMKRTTRSEGTIAAYVWDYAHGMQMMRYFWDAAMQLDSRAEALDEGKRFALCSPAALTSAFEVSGLTNIKVAPITVPTKFHDFNGFWLPFLGGQGPAPSYVASLDEESRNRLREQLRRNLPVEADGSVALVARAWAVCGTAG